VTPAPPTATPLFGSRLAFALAVVSGLLYYLALPGVNVWPAAFVALAPLLLALHGRSPRAAAALGLCAGSVMSLTGFSWLFGMLRLFSGLPAPVCLLLMVLTCVYQGGRMALTCWLTARAAARRWPAAIAFVLASVTGELLYPLLFPWYFAFTMHGTPLLLQTADLGGVYLVGALLLGPNLALAELLRARLSRSPVSWPLLGLGLAAPLAGAAYGAVRIPRVEAAERGALAVNVGVAQGNLPLVTREGGVSIHRRLTESLRDRGANLVVWSEGAIPDVFDEAGYAAQAARITGGLDVPVLFGAGLRRRVGDGTRLLNTALLSDFDGRIVGRYDKQFLLPFGEFIPFGETFPWLYDLSPNSARMIAGDSDRPVELTGHPIAVLVCYEDILPWFVNRAVSAGRPELLVNLTIDTWFGHSIEPWEHLALAQLRAVEHRRWLVRATNSGVSAIIDSAGRITARATPFVEDSFVAPVRLSAPRTVYETLGDAPFYLAALVVGAMALVPRRRRQARAAA